jgi:hypothetical protein
MLRLNGRLLDREYNNHLACFDGGLQLSPRTYEHAATNALTDVDPIVFSFLDDEAADKTQELWKIVNKMTRGDEERGPRIDGQAAEENVSKTLGREKIDIYHDDLTTEEAKKLDCEDFERIISNLNACKTGNNSRYSGYFGMENQALEYFGREMAATPGDIQARKWPDDVLVREKDHWISEKGKESPVLERKERHYW